MAKEIKRLLNPYMNFISSGNTSEVFSLSKKHAMALVDRFGLTSLFITVSPWGPGWLSGCTLLSHKVQSAGSNSRKVNGFVILDSHLSEISDYGSYDGAERRKRLN